MAEVRLNPGETPTTAARIGRVDHRIVIGPRVMFGRLVSCDCGWVGRFHYGWRRAQRAGQAHLDRWAMLELGWECARRG